MQLLQQSHDLAVMEGSLFSFGDVAGKAAASTEPRPRGHGREADLGLAFGGARAKRVWGRLFKASQGRKVSQGLDGEGLASSPG